MVTHPASPVARAPPPPPGLMNGQFGEDLAAPRRTLTPGPLSRLRARGRLLSRLRARGVLFATLVAKEPPSPAGGLSSPVALGRRAGDEGAMLAPGLHARCAWRCVAETGAIHGSGQSDASKLSAHEGLGEGARHLEHSRRP